jgi:hypothetical protein
MPACCFYYGYNDVMRTGKREEESEKTIAAAVDFRVSDPNQIFYHISFNIMPISLL